MSKCTAEVIHFIFCNINKTLIQIPRICVLNLNLSPLPPHIFSIDKTVTSGGTFNFKPHKPERKRATISAPIPGWSENLALKRKEDRSSNQRSRRKYLFPHRVLNQHLPALSVQTPGWTWLAFKLPRRTAHSWFSPTVCSSDRCLKASCKLPIPP